MSAVRSLYTGADLNDCNQNQTTLVGPSVRARCSKMSRDELQMTTISAEQLTYLASCVPRPRAPKKPNRGHCYTRFCEELC
eukprot:scaffold22056_cov52-Phaeocystis_antarctica.AAC.2